MAKDLYQDAGKSEKKDANERRRQNKKIHEKMKKRIISIAVLSLLLAACSAPSEEAEENPVEWKNLNAGEETKSTEPKEEWPEEHDSCEVQDLSEYLHEYTSISPYAGAEIMIKDYAGKILEAEWNVPSVFQFAGKADITWRFYNSLAEMETALNETAAQEADENSLHFLYYTFPMTENDHALDLYHNLKKRFDTKEHPLTVCSADNGKQFYYSQETLEEEDGYEFCYMYSRNSKVNLYVKDRTAYGLTLLNGPSEGDDETLEYVFTDVFQRYGSLGSGWVLDEENLYWIDHDERLTELENPKRRFLEVRGIDENWESAGDEGIMRYFGLLAEAEYELPLTENGRMISLHFSLAKEDGKEDAELRYYLLNGFCMDEAYDMTVTDMETGEVLQERSVSLSIELPDTITYPDLNGDGYTDMRVGTPVHSSGEKAAESDYSPPSYLLWNPQTEEFERKTEKEVANSRLATANGLTEEEQEEKSKRERSDPFALLQELPDRTAVWVCPLFSEWRCVICTLGGRKPDPQSADNESRGEKPVP